MKRTPDTFFVLAVIVLASLASVKSEYNWNGAEWVWQEDNGPQVDSRDQISEGSGDSYYEEGDDDTGGLDDYDDSSGDYEEPVETYSQNNFNTNNKGYPQQPDYTEKKNQDWGNQVDSNYKTYNPNPYDNSGGLNSQNGNSAT